MNKNLWIGLAVLAALLIVGYFLVSHRNSSTGETVKIGAALGLTGFCNTWGVDEQKAIQLAVDEANAKGGIAGREIELQIEDIQCDAKGAVSAVQKLINADHVEAVVGPTWGDSFQGADPILNENKIVAVSPSAAMEAIEFNKVPTDYIFSTWFPQRAEIEALQTEMQKRGVKKIILLHDEDAFGLVLMSLFTQGAAAHGIEVVKENSFPVGYNDFRTTIAQLKTVGTDAIFTSFMNPPTKGAFLKQAYEGGLKVQLFSTTDIQDPQILSDFGSVLDGVIYTSAVASGDNDTFTKNFTARFGAAPSGPSVTNAYDAAHVVIAALAEHYKNGTDMKKATESITIPGVTVKDIRFNPAHQITDVQFQIKTIKNGQFVSAY